MQDKKLIHTLRLKNLLSYGSEGQEIRLEPLNVLIGTNASGKSNLIEAIELLHATPRDLTAPIREGGGIREWLWKGTNSIPVAEIEAIVDYPEGRMPLRYLIRLTMVGQRLELVDEAIESERPNPGKTEAYFFYPYTQGAPVLNVRLRPEDQVGTDQRREKRFIRRDDISPEQSVLFQRKDQDHYPERWYLSTQFSKIRLYREWNLGRYTPPRNPQPADLPQDFLLENASNLGLVLNELQHYPDVWKLILDKFGFRPGRTSRNHRRMRTRPNRQPLASSGTPKTRVLAQKVFFRRIVANGRIGRDTMVTEGEYTKRHGLEILKKIDPAQVQTVAPHCGRLFKQLMKKLTGA